MDKIRLPILLWFVWVGIAVWGNARAQSADTAWLGQEVHVGFVISDGVYNSELMAPFDVFHHTIFHAKPGMKVFTIAPKDTVVTSFEGIRILPDYSFANAPRIDVLVVPSAEHHMDSDLQNEALVGFIKSKGQSAKYIVSLCDGAFMLAQAGLLDGHECTTFPGDIGAFRKMFPQLKVHEKVSFVHHGKAITSAGGAISYDPALYLVELLYGKRAAEGVGKGICIDWRLKKVKHMVLGGE